MKFQNFFILLIGGISLLACGGDKESSKVPPAVNQSFNGLFADVSELEWKHEEASWEADFIMNGISYSAVFNEDGTWEETEEEIDLNDVPPGVKYTLDSRYSKYSIEEAEKVVNAEGIAYEFELVNGDDEMELLISSDGEVLKIEVESKEDLEED